MTSPTSTEERRRQIAKRQMSAQHRAEQSRDRCQKIRDEVLPAVARWCERHDMPQGPILNTIDDHTRLISGPVLKRYSNLPLVIKLFDGDILRPDEAFIADILQARDPHRRARQVFLVSARQSMFLRDLLETIQNESRKVPA